jgi:hypothetical protein
LFPSYKNKIHSDRSFCNGLGIPHSTTIKQAKEMLGGYDNELMNGKFIYILNLVYRQVQVVGERYV